MYFKKVSVKEKMPPLDKFVTTIDEAGEHRVYRRVSIEGVPDGENWNMRDADGINSPNNNLPITHWLMEVREPEKLTEFKLAALPLIKHLAENYHPHVTAIVTSTSAELLESKQSVNEIYDYIAF